MPTVSSAIDAATRVCAIFGHPIGHSASPAMHNAAMAELGLNWRYLAFDVQPEDLRSALLGAKAMKVVGLNLTVPHKVLAVEMVDVLDPAAKVWGAVNTVRFETRRNGEWVPVGQCPVGEIGEVRSHGFNTDADAVARAIEEDLGLGLRGTTVLVLGAGGAGRTAALKLASEGVDHVYLVNRTMEKAAEVGREIGTLFPGVKVTMGYPAGGVDLVVNATSLGLKDADPLPFDGGAFSLTQAKAAYDLIYRPAETRFLSEAKAAGCQTANGLGMLLYQGAKALELWCGKAAPVETMRRALVRNVYGA